METDGMERRCVCVKGGLLGRGDSGADKRGICEVCKVGDAFLALKREL